MGMPLALQIIQYLFIFVQLEPHLPPLLLLFLLSLSRWVSQVQKLINYFIKILMQNSVQLLLGKKCNK